MICLQTNGYIGPRTDVNYRGRDEELVFTPQYLFRHEASAPIPATILPPSDEDFSTFYPDPDVTFISDQEYFQKFAVTENPLFPEYEPINFNFEYPLPEEVALPKIGMTEAELEPTDITTDPVVVSDGIGQTSELPKILTVVTKGEHPVLLDEKGTRVDADCILGKPEYQDTFNIYDPFNQKDAVNPLFNFMHGFTSQEDLSGSNTNYHNRWLPLFKPIFPRKKQRIMKRMSAGETELAASESGKQEVQIPSPHVDSMKIRKVKEVFNRVDNYISTRIQNCINKLKHIMDSEHQLLENMYQEEAKKVNEKKM